MDSGTQKNEEGAHFPLNSYHGTAFGEALSLQFPGGNVRNYEQAAWRRFHRACRLTKTSPKGEPGDKNRRIYLKGIPREATALCGGHL